MTEKDNKYLSDIFSAIELIESFMIGINSYNDYVGDFKSKSAIERQLLIIGEAVNKFLKENPDNKLEHAIQIIGLRNRLVHAYDGIDDSIIWNIVIRHLHALKIEVKNKLN